MLRRVSSVRSQAVALGGLHDDLELALIVVRNEVLADQREAAARSLHTEQRRQHDHPAVAQRPAQHRAVAAVDRGVDAALLAWCRSGAGAESASTASASA